MNQLRVLLHKEWRDQRVLALGMLLLCVLLVVLARLIIGTRLTPHFRESTLLPACLGVFVVGVAVESIARDRQNGVDEALAKLPVPLASAWFAKLCFLVLASISFLAALAILEAGMLLAEHLSIRDGLLAMYQPTWWLAIAAIAAACQASACVVRRSLPAALLGVALIVCVPLVATSLPTEWVDLVLASWSPAAISRLVCAAFLLGSLLAQRVRRPDALMWRRAAQAWLGVGLVLGPAFANSVRVGELAFDILPFSKAARIWRLSLSPDGRHIAMQVSQTWRPRQDWLPLTASRSDTNPRVRSEVWILDPATGAVKEIDERSRFLTMENPWDLEGRLVTVSVPGTLGEGEHRAERIDPSTGGVSASHRESESDFRDYERGFERWFEESWDGDLRVFSWSGREEQLRLQREVFAAPSPEPGVVFHKSGSALVRHELADDSTHWLAELPEARPMSLCISPDGRFLLFGEQAGERILDSRDGHVIGDLPKQSRILGWSRIRGRVGFQWTHGVTQLLLEDGSLTRVPGSSRLCELGSDRLIAYSMGWIECVNLDGSERRTLYEARP